MHGFFGRTKATENGYGIWNLECRSLYRSGSLKTPPRELAMHKLDFVEVKEVRWDKGGIKPADDYTFFLWKWQ
jgi:hypothetical protein